MGIETHASVQLPQQKLLFGSCGKKAWFQENFFHFQNFGTFGNLETYFSINLSKFLWTAINNSGVIFFLGYATKKLQACSCNTVTLNIIFDIYLYLCKDLLFESNRILSYMIPDYILRSYFTW